MIGLLELTSATYAYFQVWALVKADGNTCQTNVSLKCLINMFISLVPYDILVTYKHKKTVYKCPLILFSSLIRLSLNGIVNKVIAQQ